VTDNWDESTRERARSLYNAGRTWLTYAASGCAGGNYTLGLLKLMPNADRLVAKSWVKTEKPVFAVRPLLGLSASNHPQLRLSLLSLSSYRLLTECTLPDTTYVLCFPVGFLSLPIFF
jgi:hypothetical protein